MADVKKVFEVLKDDLNIINLYTHSALCTHDRIELKNETVFSGLMELNIKYETRKNICICVDF